MNGIENVDDVNALHAEAMRELDRVQENMSIIIEENEKKMKNIQSIQKWIKTAMAAMNALYDKRLTLTIGGFTNSLGTFTDGSGQSFSVKAWMEENGIKVAGASAEKKEEKWKLEDINNSISNIDAACANASDQINAETIKLQKLSNDYIKNANKMSKIINEMKDFESKIIQLM